MTSKPKLNGSNNESNLNKNIQSEGVLKRNPLITALRKSLSYLVHDSHVIQVTFFKNEFLLVNILYLLRYETVFALLRFIVVQTAKREG